MGSTELTQTLLDVCSQYVSEAIMDIYGNDISNALNGMTANRGLISSLVCQRIIQNIKQEKLGF